MAVSLNNFACRLVFLDLYHNRLDLISNIDSLVNLRVLMLGKNRIRRVEGLLRCNRLSVLDLHGNRITQVKRPGSFFNALARLRKRREFHQKSVKCVPETSFYSSHYACSTLYLHLFQKRICILLPFLSYVDYRTRQPGRAEGPQLGREPPSQNFQPPRLNELGRAERTPQPNPQPSRTRSGPNFGEALFKQQRDSSESVIQTLGIVRVIPFVSGICHT